VGQSQGLKPGIESFYLEDRTFDAPPAFKSQALVVDRSLHQEAERDWEGFFEACGDDPLIEEVARLLGRLDARIQVVLLTGRPLGVQPQTVGWLDRHDLRWELLVMRDFGDYRAALEFKRKALHELRDYGFQLRLAFEDDRRNLEMFRAEDLPCVYIHSGYYE
jgi:hypothetical protein